MSSAEEQNVFVEEEVDISSIKIDFPINKTHIENMIDVFRKKRVNSSLLSSVNNFLKTVRF